MKRYVCVRNDEVLLLEETEIIQHLLKGAMFDEIFEVGKEMELQIRLVPSKGKKKNVKTEEVNEATEVAVEEEAPASNGVSAKRGRRSSKKMAEASA